MTTPESDTIPYAIRIPRKRFVAFLVLIVIVLLTSYILLQTTHYRWHVGHWVLKQLFDLDGEDTFPNWFSTASLFFTSSLLYVIWSTKKQERDRFAHSWLVLSVGSLIMSVDEVAGMHEALNWVSSVSWTVPGAILAAALGLYFVPFLIHLPMRYRVLFILAGAIYVGGAVGVEHLTDRILDRIQGNNDMHTLGYKLMVVIEEGMEMSGVVLFISSLLEYMNPGKVVSISLIFEEDPA